MHRLFTVRNFLTKMKKNILFFCFLFGCGNAVCSPAIPHIQNASMLQKSDFPSKQLLEKTTPLPKHPFHISKFDLVYNSKEKTWQITGHLFIDDLETALQKQGIDKLFLCSNKEAPKAQEYVAQYLKQHFSIEINEKTIEWTFLGKETSDDLKAVWCYMEIKNATLPQTILIKNNVLTEVFGDQKNMISVTTENQQKGYFILTARKTKEKMTL